MANNLVTVLLIGMNDAKPHTTERNGTLGFECHYLDNDENLERALVEHHPQVIVTFGDVRSYKRLWNAPIEIRKRWLNFDKPIDPLKLGSSILSCYAINATGRIFGELPLMSIITPTYRTGRKIFRPFNSLMQQTYKNWEWVIFDDSMDDDKTYNEMCHLAKQDHRISVYKAHRHCGVIGELKRRAAMLSKGDYIVELDHDDELTHECLDYVIEAFKQFNDAGFAYGDCAEIYDDGRNRTYGRWAFDYGSYRKEIYDGRELFVTNYPNINSKTIRHIVGVPNHVRAWRKDDYFVIGGHGSDVHVADDYELLLRTFLYTPMIKIPKLTYIQYHNRNGGGNTQMSRNAEIQRLVRQFSHHYNKEIHDRFMELGVDDFIWAENGLNWNVPNKDPESIANYVAVF
jgi:glycosyltransferase involved in cell wall biosynthesis